MASDVPEDLSAFADELADAAGQVIRKYWRTRVEVISKDARLDVFGDEPVTIADRESERVMRDMIEQRYPAHAILGEEHGAKGDGKTSEWCWVLDPVDGTKSFITGKPLFGTLIALLNYGKPVLGVIDQCVLKERWKGSNGKTTFNGRPCSTDDCTSLNEAMVYATTPEMFAPGLETRAWNYLSSRCKRALYGCDCYAYGLCASGSVQLVCEADLMPYDYLAVVPVVVGAGGLMTDWEGRPLTLPNHDQSKGRVLCAANAKLHSEALAALKQAPPFSRVARDAFLLGLACGVAAMAFLRGRK